MHRNTAVNRLECENVLRFCTAGRFDKGSSVHKSGMKTSGFVVREGEEAIHNSPVTVGLEMRMEGYVKSLYCTW